MNRGSLVILCYLAAFILGLIAVLVAATVISGPSVAEMGFGAVCAIALGLLLSSLPVP